MLFLGLVIFTVSVIPRFTKPLPQVFPYPISLQEIDL